MTLTDIDGSAHQFDHENYSYSWRDNGKNWHLEFCNGDHYTVSSSEYNRLVTVEWER